MVRPCFPASAKLASEDKVDAMGTHTLKEDWVEGAKKRLHHNVLTIALANKLARIAWSVLARGRSFETSKLQTAYTIANNRATRRSLREEEMEVRSSRRLRILVTRMAHLSLSANKVADALISMMARSNAPIRGRRLAIQLDTRHSKAAAVPIVYHSSPIGYRDNTCGPIHSAAARAYRRPRARSARAPVRIRDPQCGSPAENSVRPSRPSTQAVA